MSFNCLQNILFELYKICSPDVCLYRYTTRQKINVYSLKYDLVNCVTMYSCDVITAYLLSTISNHLIMTLPSMVINNSKSLDQLHNNELSMH